MFRKNPNSTVDPARELRVPWTYTSRNLNHLLQRLPASPKPYLLDIGPLNGSNINWWIRRGIRVYVLDCYREFGIQATDRGDMNPISKLELPKGVRFDAIVCWDLFDHLPFEQSRRLIEKLGPLLNPQGLLFCLFNFKPESSRILMRYRIVDEKLLEYQPVRTAVKRKVYENRQIGELLRDFELVSSYLLKNQMREVLAQKAAGAKPTANGLIPDRNQATLSQPSAHPTSARR